MQLLSAFKVISFKLECIIILVQHGNDDNNVSEVIEIEKKKSKTSWDMQPLSIKNMA